LADHDQELVGLEVMQLDGAGGTLGGAYTAAHALGGSIWPLPSLLQNGAE